MKRIAMVMVALCLVLMGCEQQVKDNVLIHRSFYNTIWERFDYVATDVVVKEATTYDLNLSISFTEDYPYDYIDLVFVVFTSEGDRYRAKEYKPKLKDADGQWSAQLVDGCYTFTLPINKQLVINDSGTYRFQIEQKMPITPLVGVKELTLLNN
ncbi:MAG: hypothetical protein IJ622_12540 [Bacteroidales bacterium]|nr:hypothetical protein [Bacteroidales bacterium]